jgi:hypothetical protein
MEHGPARIVRLLTPKGRPASERFEWVPRGYR